MKRWPASQLGLVPAHRRPMAASNTLDELVNNNLSSDFYPHSSFDSGFADPNDPFDTQHNPFADFKPSADFTPPSIPSSSAEAFQNLTSNSNTDYHIASNHFFESEDDAKKDSSFHHYHLGDDDFADHHPNQLPGNHFVPNDPAFQDQDLLQHSPQPTPEILSPISPHQSRILTKPPSPTGLLNPEHAATISKPEPFRPFGVTATLTSSSDEPMDEPLLNNASLRSVTNSRPPLPDILGGGSLGDSALLPESRSALPAFKKTPKKPKQSATIGSVSPSPNSNRNVSNKGPTTNEAPKLYRPLGLKIAQPKPIIAVVAEDCPTSSPATITPSQPPAPKVAEPVLTTSSTPAQIPNKAPSVRRASHPTKSSQDCSVDQPSSPETTTQNCLQQTTAGDAVTYLETSVTPNETVADSLANAPHPEAHDAPVLTEVSNLKSTPATASNLAIIVPALPDSLPSVSESRADRWRANKPSDNLQEPTNDHSTGRQQDSISLASEAIIPLPPPNANLAHQKICSAAPVPPELKPSSDSDSEDERPLASVREGLVQQQSGRRDPATGLTPSTPSQISFGSQDPLRNVTLPPPGPRYMCHVGDPQKMGMINDIHTVYTVRTVATDPSASGPLENSSTVLRRFRDFVWLFDTLTSNNPGVIVPPIPDKNLRSRFQEGFIATRRVALEIFLQKTANHPMLVSDPDLKLFLESDSFSLEIKHRKPDASNQSGWLANIAGPRFHEMDDFFDHRKASLDSLEAQLKSLHSSLSTASKARRLHSQSLSELSQSLLTLSTCDLSRPIRNSLDRLAGLHRQCHLWSEEQSKQELEGLIATVEAYSRLIGSVRLTFAARVKSWEKWQTSLANLRKVQTNHEKTKKYSTNENSTGLMYSLKELAEAERKARDAREEFDDVSLLIKAEMQRFDKEKVEDFKSAISSYVEGITDRQRQIVHVWQEYYLLLQSLSKQNVDASLSSTQQSSSLNGNNDNKLGPQDPANPVKEPIQDTNPSLSSVPEGSQIPPEAVPSIQVLKNPHEQLLISQMTSDGNGVSVAELANDPSPWSTKEDSQPILRAASPMNDLSSDALTGEGSGFENSPLLSSSSSLKNTDQVVLDYPDMSGF